MQGLGGRELAAIAKATRIGGDAVAPPHRFYATNQGDAAPGAVRIEYGSANVSGL